MISDLTYTWNYLIAQTLNILVNIHLGENSEHQKSCYGESHVSLWANNKYNATLMQGNKCGAQEKIQEKLQD